MPLAPLRIQFVILLSFVSLAVSPAQEPKTRVKAKSTKLQTPLPTQPPLVSVDIASMPPGVQRLDLFLLIGQSNMKGRGLMPEEPSRDPRIVMMHMKDDRWYVARHPLHLVGSAQTFVGADNAGVGPGLAFAERLVEKDAARRVGLVPCAVGGSRIDLWKRGAKLYDEAMRRAKQAQQQTESVGGTFRGVLWLQGEADANEEKIGSYQEKLLKLVDDLRADLASPSLPFIACTIGEMRPSLAGDVKVNLNSNINEILLSLPLKRPHTSCVDARDLKTHIGDFVHFDTAAQNEMGKRFAEKFFSLQ